MTALSVLSVAAPRRPLGRLALSLSGALAALWLLALTPAGDSFLASLNILTAQVTAALSAAVGLPLVREETVLLHGGGFACVIDFACTATAPAVLLAAAIWPWPASGRARLIGIAAGALLLIVVNQLRLVHLVWLGVYMPEYFDAAHVWFWPLLLVASAVGYWFVWFRMARHNSA